MAKIVVDMISVFWEGEVVRIIVDDNISGKAQALRQIFGEENVGLMLGHPLPDRSPKERNTALALYKQAEYVLREDKIQQAAWVAGVNDRFKNK